MARDMDRKKLVVHSAAIALGLALYGCNRSSPAMESLSSQMESAFSSQLPPRASINNELQILPGTEALFVIGTQPSEGEAVLFVFNGGSEPISFENSEFGVRLFLPDYGSESWTEAERLTHPEARHIELSPGLEEVDPDLTNVLMLARADFPAVANGLVRVVIDGEGTLSGRPYVAFTDIELGN